MVQKGSKEARNKGAAAIVGPRMSIESSRPRGRRRAFGLLLVGLAALPATISLAADRSADGGLAAHWNFGEGAGDTVKDSSGNGNDGAIVATPPSEAKWGAGEFSRALSVRDGGHVLIPASDSLNKLRRAITVTAHVYPRSLWSRPPFYQRVWNRARGWFGPVEPPTRSSPGFTAVVKRQWRFAGHPSVFYLGYGRNGNVECYKWHVGLVDGETDVYRLPEGQSRPAVGRWVHIAGVYDAASGKASLYVDGKLLGDDTQAGEMRLDPESLSRPLMIGGELIDADVNDVQNVFDGYLDDVRVYDRALSAEEIGKLAAEAEDKRVAR
jgi:hypothetical protein